MFLGKEVRIILKGQAKEAYLDIEKDKYFPLLFQAPKGRRRLKLNFYLYTTISQILPSKSLISLLSIGK